MPWITQEAIKDLGPGKSYSIAWVLDPVILNKMGQTVTPTNIAQQRQFARDIPANEQGLDFIESVKQWNPFGVNVMFALLSGDIGF